jgi:hypothetical protein
MRRSRRWDRGRRPASTFRRRSSSAVTRTPAGNFPKNGFQRPRMTLTISTSYPC